MIHCFNTHMEHEVGALAKGQEQRQSIGGALDSCQGCRQQLAHCICAYQTPTTSNQAASGHHRRPEQTIQSNQSTAIYGADPPQQSRLSPEGLGANEQRHSMFNQQQQQHAHETSSQTNSNLAPPQAGGSADRIHHHHHHHHHHASSTKQQPINQISNPDAIERHQRDRNDLLIESSHQHQPSGVHRVDPQIDNVERNARHKCEGHPENHPSTDLYDRLYGSREDQDPNQHQAGLNDDWTNQFQSFDFGALHQEEPFPTENQHNQHSSTSSLRSETSDQTTTTSCDPHGSYRSSSSSSVIVQQQQVDAKPLYDLNNNQNSNELSSGQHDSDGTPSFARLMPPMVEPISHLHSHQDQRNNQQQTTGSNEYYQQHYTGGTLDQQHQQQQHISSSEVATSNPYLNSVSQHRQQAISLSSSNGTGEPAGTTSETITGTPNGVGSHQQYHHHQYQSPHLDQQQHHHYEHQGSSSSFQEYYTYTNCDANSANPGPNEQQHGVPPTQTPYHSYGLEDQDYQQQQQQQQHEHDGQHYQQMQEQANCYQQPVPPTEACGNSHLLMVSSASSASITSSMSTISSSNSPSHHQRQQQQQKAQTLCAPLTSNGQNGVTANTPMKKLMKSIHSTSGSRTATGGGGSCGKSTTITTSGRNRRGRPRKKGSCAKGKVSGKLWEFIRDLLLSERTNPSFIRWERREDGVFKFVQSDKVAKMWGERKQNPKMTYEKLSRAMRYYYKSKVLLPVFGRRLVYKFGPNATGWMAVSGSCSSTSPSSLSGGPNSNSSSLGGGNLSPPVVSSSVVLSSGSGGTTPMGSTPFYHHPHQQPQQDMSQVGGDQVMQVIAVEAQQQQQQQQQYGLVQYDQGHLVQAGPDQQTILHGNHQHNEIIY